MQALRSVITITLKIEACNFKKCPRILIATKFLNENCEFLILNLKYEIPRGVEILR